MKRWGRTFPETSDQKPEEIEADRGEENASVRAKQDGAADGESAGDSARHCSLCAPLRTRTSGGPRACLGSLRCDAADRKIQSKSRKENFQGLGQRGGRIICEERTKTGEEKCGFGCTV